MSTVNSNLNPATVAMPPSLDIKMISAMRLILSLSALVIVNVDPTEPNRFAGLNGALICYSLYSGVLYLLSMRPASSLALRMLPWVDLTWYLALIALSGGTNSIFFFFLFFAILVASFWWGLVFGLSMTVASAVLFTLVGYVSAPAEPEFQLNRFLLRPVYLLVLGYLISYWGGHEVKLKRRLQFLKDINRLSNPRFGVNRTLDSAMSRLRSFYHAETCLLVLRGDDGYSLRRIDDKSADQALVRELDQQLSYQLLLPATPHAVIYRGGASGSTLYDISTGTGSEAPKSIESVANTLEASSFLSVPLYYRGESTGRLYLIARREHFNQSDIEFILQAIDQIIPVLDNIRLVDDLASSAAEEERQKIARDIHDGVIQPYIGLTLGLTAVSQKLARGDTDVADDVKNLSDLVARQIANLRYYVGKLKTTEPGDSALLPALRRFASKFSQATGIDVTVSAPEDVPVNDRLAAEIFYMFTEGLSNVRRHTHAQHAEARLLCENGHVVVRIENENPNGAARTLFNPRSLAGRAEALGGELSVSINPNDRTIVSIKIPL